MTGLKAIVLAILCWVWLPPTLAQDEASDEAEAAVDEGQEIGDSEDSASTDAAPSDGTAEPKPMVKRHEPNPNKWRLGDVTRFLDNYSREEEVLTFEQQDGNVSGLYLPENTGKPQGGVLILHDVDQHAHWPQTVAPLREYLPDYGWNTLSLFMNQGIKKPLPPIERPKPMTPETPTTEGEESEEPATEEISETQVDEAVAETPDEPITDAADEEIIDDSAPPADELDGIADSLDEIPDLAAKADAMSEPEEEKEDPAEAYIKDSTNRVSAGINQLNTLGQFNLVIIAHGANANWAAAALNEIYERSPDAKGFALILVDARANTFPPYPLNSMLANLDIPMLDLVTINDEIPIQQSIDRRNTMRRNQRENYQQIRIPAVRSPLRGKHNTITRRVRGWLQTNAAGEEVEIKG